MKSYGKFKQWTGERLGASAKTEADAEFRDLEQQLGLREQGLQALHDAATTWLKHLAKRQDQGSHDKATPLENLGAVLLQHSGELPHDSEYGQVLLTVGTAEQKIARLDDRFGRQVHDAMLDNVKRMLVHIKDFHTARKKLESRRLTYDSAMSKMAKAKKDDPKAEEELRTARIRFEEQTNDVAKRMDMVIGAEPDLIAWMHAFAAAERDRHRQAMEVVEEMMNSLACSPPSHEADNPGSRAPSPSSAAILPPQQQQIKSVNSELTQRNLSQQSLVLSEETDHLAAVANSTLVQANFNFDPARDEELVLRIGDLVEVLQRHESGWWTGRKVDGAGAALSRPGLFPENYCTPLDSPTTNPRRPTPRTHVSETSTSLTATKATPMTRAVSHGALGQQHGPSSSKLSLVEEDRDVRSRLTPTKGKSRRRPPPPIPSGSTSTDSLGVPDVAEGSPRRTISSRHTPIQPPAVQPRRPSYHTTTSTPR
ncbi:hypothetical protein PYCC9005_000912 [Savitreella phatthalungensis]